MKSRWWQWVARFREWSAGGVSCDTSRGRGPARGSAISWSCDWQWNGDGTATDGRSETERFLGGYTVLGVRHMSPLLGGDYYIFGTHEPLLSRHHKGVSCSC